jgi:hypothetical protein
MELLKPNYIDTVTSIIVNNNSSTVENILNPDLTYQFVSSGMNDDTTTTTMRIAFSETTLVSRIAIAGINLKKFNLYYDAATANTFALTSTGATITSRWITNSESAMYLQCTGVYCTSVSLDMYSTQVANSEKAIGYFVLSTERLNFTRIPAAKNYTPLRNAKEVIHSLSDGRTRIQTVSDMWSFDIKLEYIDETMRNSLRTIYDLHAPHIFVPFGTTTAWDGIISPVVWQSPFTFYKVSDNAVSAGFEGSMKLMETTP